MTVSEGDLNVSWLGRVAYREAWELQQRLAELVKENAIPNTLLLLEHPPTITLGRNAHADHVLEDAGALAERGIELIASDRGGDVTYHGPGQLVGYPILDLKRPPFRTDLHWYLRQLEETLIRSLAQFGLAAGRFPGYTGVWLGMDSEEPRKVAAIGVRCSRWVTHHGFALNVSTDLEDYGTIVPCGIRGFGVTSLEKEINRSLSLDEVVPVLAKSFGEVFRLHLNGSRGSISGQVALGQSEP